MDSLITAAARALAAGDAVGALKRIALRGDAAALALRGIAMAQLGEFARARMLVRSAARAFGAAEAVERARCVVAEAEIALASRDLGWPTKPLLAAQATLELHGDRLNSAHARYLQIRRQLLVGQLADAQRNLERIDARPLPPALRAVHELAAAGIALRRLDTKAARDALTRGAAAARAARIPALMAEVRGAAQTLTIPAARLRKPGMERMLLLEEVEALFASRALIVDACRYTVRRAQTVVSLATRPVLFTLARALAEAWPADAGRDALISRAFRVRHADESYRARLRVEVGRLRRALRALADVQATPRGFALVARGASEVVTLARPFEEEHADVLACLADGEAWSSSGLALALGVSQRSVQRALDTLAAAGRVQALGGGRARRWTMPPLPGFATSLLLPAPLPGD